MFQTSVSSTSCCLFICPVCIISPGSTYPSTLMHSELRLSCKYAEHVLWFVRVSKQVSADSKEAKSYLKNQSTKTKDLDDKVEDVPGQPMLPGPRYSLTHSLAFHFSQSRYESHPFTVATTVSHCFFNFCLIIFFISVQIFNMYYLHLNICLNNKVEVKLSMLVLLHLHLCSSQ